MSLTETEACVLESFLKWDAPEMDRLRIQLEYIKENASKLMYVPEYLWEHVVCWPKWFRPKRYFRGFPFEDCQLGNRRRVVLDDVALTVADGSMVCLELEIARGFLRSFSVKGVATGVEAPITPSKLRTTRQLRGGKIVYIKKSPDGQQVASVLKQREETEGLRSLCRRPIEPTTPFQQWLDDLARNPLQRFDHVELECEPFKYPLGVSLAPPATEEDFHQFESRCGVEIPHSIAEMWRFSNGMSLYEREVVGSYDANVFPRSRMYPINKDEMVVVLLQTDYQGFGFDTYRSGTGIQPDGRIFEFTGNIFHRVRDWPNLWDFMKELVADIQAEVQPPDQHPRPATP